MFPLTRLNLGVHPLGAGGCRRQARPPAAAKARMTLRTVWSPQPNWRAIWRAVRPSALARRIWLRRKVKALEERKPVRKVSRSGSLKGRLKIGVFILSYL